MDIYVVKMRDNLNYWILTWFCRIDSVSFILMIVFILDTLVKALSIVFWYLVFSGIFGFFR